MYTVDDSMLALILRFIGSEQQVNYCNNTFIEKQVHVIQSYVDSYPDHEKQHRAIEWIEKYAREYRKNWEKDIIIKGLEKKRCSDCPLTTDSGSDEHCQIHYQWKELLEKYLQNEISSEIYVENTLALLEKHKNSLRVLEIEH